MTTWTLWVPANRAPDIMGRCLRDRQTPQAKQETSAVAASGGDAAAPQQIFVVTEDRELAGELKVQLCYFGYDADVCHTLADFRLAIRPDMNVVVLMDTTFQEGGMAGVDIMKGIQQGRETAVPVVFFSAHDTVQARLEGVRAGSIAYLNKPVNIGNLIDKLGTMASARTADPYRVMIVDDSVALTAYHAAILEQAGMAVKVVNNPLEVAEALFDFTPDLILIDIYMPGCSGMELAKVIRQLDAFVSIPIVFLSTEKISTRSFWRWAWVGTISSPNRYSRSIWFLR